MDKTIIKYIKKNNGLIWLVCLLGPSVFSLLSQYYTAIIGKNIIAKLTANSTFTSILLTVFFGMIGVVISQVLWGIANFVQINFKNNIDRKLKIQTYNKILKIKYTLLQTTDQGQLFIRYNSDSENAISTMTDDLFSISYSLILGIGISLIILHENLLLGLIILFIVIVVLFTNTYFISKNISIETEIKKSRDAFSNDIIDIIKGKGSIRLLGVQDNAEIDVNSHIEYMLENDQKAVKTTLHKSLTMDWFVYSCATMILPLACILAVKNVIKLENVVFIVQLAGNIIWNTKSLGESIIKFKTHRISLERLETLLNSEEEDLDNYKCPEINEKSINPITFENVSINYGEQVLLRNCSFECPHGKLTVIAGLSGSGKSSILKSLLGFNNHEGKINLFGWEIKHLPLPFVRDMLSYMPESCDIYNTTIKENILNGRELPDTKRIEDLLIKFDLEEFLIADKWESESMGEMGNKLSGGQRQKIALIRAFLKDAPIYILDEPTANLDYQSEDVIIEYIKELTEQGKTAIVISHRKAMLMRADNIIYIDNNTTLNDISKEEAICRLDKVKTEMKE